MKNQATTSTSAYTLKSQSSETQNPIQHPQSKDQKSKTFESEFGAQSTSSRKGILNISSSNKVAPFDSEEVSSSSVSFLTKIDQQNKKEGEIQEDGSSDISRLFQKSRSKEGFNMGSDEDPQEYDRFRKIFKYGLGAVSVSGVLGVILMWTFLIVATPAGQSTFAFSGSSSLHIAIMISIFVFLQGYAILIYRIFPEKPRFLVKLSHFGLHLAVTLGVITGFSSIISYKNHAANILEEENIKANKVGPSYIHFVSVHSWIGLIAIVMYYGQFLGGLCVFLLPVAPTRFRTLALPFHKINGVLIFTLCFLTALTGYMYKQDTCRKDDTCYSGNQIVLRFSAIFMVIYFLGVLMLLTEHNFRRRPRPEGDILLEDTSKDDD